MAVINKFAVNKCLLLLYAQMSQFRVIVISITIFMGANVNWEIAKNYIHCSKENKMNPILLLN